MRTLKPKKTAVFRWRICVEGSGDFPLDMLRYDACVPDRQEDVFELARKTVEKRIVWLRRFALNPLLATAGRWESFGWRVVVEEPAP